MVYEPFSFLFISRSCTIYPPNYKVIYIHFFSLLTFSFTCYWTILSCTCLNCDSEITTFINFDMCVRCILFNHNTINFHCICRVGCLWYISWIEGRAWPWQYTSYKIIAYPCYWRYSYIIDMSIILRYFSWILNCVYMYKSNLPYSTYILQSINFAIFAFLNL